ncbi:hypothetical protein GZ989_003905 [Campylobacter fetus]|uniref:hypothetical protein n=1 Tax=Campylobacter fetus TaxID=196 RepID=UPI0001BCE5C5|nr:hypothetical protein [Campylobacter fetus]OCS20704.1 hypothetical protein CFVI97532_09930 [Campylobacter fetus subsp. venerealis cfvi97/532]OCS38269.1 hypothetical protein CFVI02298_09990 [Campylobacter fetus subsp. venerealis cfvi02/298]AHE94373.1 hypothetical protein CFVI03293_1068 [Campylobacter fetus subsp. venerealis cfvi03/293]AHE95160.1 hypothetical protein CFVI03293_A0033 [Campylobacter fetus subsp. venerealis cfvi03/293]EAI3887243.1 hypothetical protein [Campylobacter fetus]
MENRKFNIEYLGVEWFIEAPSYDEDKAKKLKIIAPITSVIDGKIAQIFDILTPQQEDIEEAKKYKEFHEICDFEVLSNGYKFTGTFIDALEYIKANFS